MTTDLYDDLQEEIYALIFDWIMTNDIQYSRCYYLRRGYFEKYPKGTVNVISSNFTVMMLELQWVLGRYNIQALYERYKGNKGGWDAVILSVIENEKLRAIHEKMLLWAERHRLRPEFNKVEKGRKKCYRPTQYLYAVSWLWRNYRKRLRLWWMEKQKIQQINISF